MEKERKNLITLIQIPCAKDQQIQWKIKNVALIIL